MDLLPPRSVSTSIFNTYHKCHQISIYAGGVLKSFVVLGPHLMERFWNKRCIGKEVERL